MTKPRNYTLTEDKMLREDELKLMLKTIKPFMRTAVSHKKQVHFINDYFLVLIGSLTGLRVSEICNLTIGDIDNNSIKIIGKGRKLRVIPIGPKGKAAIEELLRLKKEVLNQPVSQDQCLFLNRNGKPFTRFSVGRRFNFWKVRCGIDRPIGWHSLRHRFACHLLNHGFLIHEVSRFLGHSSITTTSVYLHFTYKTRQKVDSIL